MGFKAEVVMGFLLVARHRAPRVAIGFGMVLAVAAGATPRSALVAHVAWLAISGAIASVACSRLLARGAALEAMRLAAADPKVAVGGRFMGAMLVVLPCVVGVGLSVGGGGGSEAFVSAMRYSVTIGAAVTIATAVIGASGAAACGLALVTIAAALASGGPTSLDPDVARVWGVLPASMGAARPGSLAVFFLWLALCLWSAARVAAPTLEEGR